MAKVYEHQELQTEHPSELDIRKTCRDSDLRLGTRLSNEPVG